MAGFAHSARKTLLGLLAATPLYEYSLQGRRIAELVRTPAYPRDGDAELADAIFQGRYRFAGSRQMAPGKPPWNIPESSEEWRAALQSFDWLRHFRARGGTASERHARNLVGSWLTHCGQYEPLAWRADILGRRLVAWLCHSDFLLVAAEQPFSEQFLDSIARQLVHLGRAWRLAPTGAGRLDALLGLVYGALCLPDGDQRLEGALALLISEIDDQVPADGGHVSRSPALQQQILGDLAGLRQALQEARFEVPLALQTAIDRMAPMLRFYQHGDGGLAWFNGAAGEPDGSTDRILVSAEANGRPPPSAPHTGFERLQAGRTLAIVDCGSASAADSGNWPHAGCLSFELSSGRDRLVVNCGAAEPRTAPLARALRSTPAHSTLSVDESSQFDIGDIEAHVECRTQREDADGNVWFEGQHDGFLAAYGLHHRRKLYLSADGADLRGEDALLVKGPGARTTPFFLRFHLHPDVDASLVQDGRTVILRSGSGQGWRFRSAGGAVTLEESLHVPLDEKRRKAEQIVISAETVAAEETLVKWSFSRVDDPDGRARS
ncbi:heparinase II/III family protein [Oceanibacterium hippocampi]|uniref:Heparinase II/III-like protein n=1 Tax=Oceanibacterium hippocampi TaxID=745714 RepID=A0A1Y5RF27_9PROT|nr:heparinase II/III family protein [Oceanibacterium hippocampi]SLN15760.1 Heparinase II/III-like protein [Oceanibacterium hippocampi]